MTRTSAASESAAGQGKSLIFRRVFLPDKILQSRLKLILKKAKKFHLTFAVKRTVFGEAKKVAEPTSQQGEELLTAVRRPERREAE